MLVISDILFHHLALSLIVAVSYHVMLQVVMFVSNTYSPINHLTTTQNT